MKGRSIKPMKNRNKYITLGILFIVLISFFLIILYKGVSNEMENTKQECLFRVDLIPFRIETYVPVNKSDIGITSHYRIGFYKKHEFCDKLKTMFESQHTQTEINEKMIRLKMQDFEDKVVYYVDQNGIVLKNNSESFKLVKSEMDTIEQGIIYFSGVVDCKVVTE